MRECNCPIPTHLHDVGCPMFRPEDGNATIPPSTPPGGERMQPHPAVGRWSPEEGHGTDMELRGDGDFVYYADYANLWQAFMDPENQPSQFGTMHVPSGEKRVTMPCKHNEGTTLAYDHVVCDLCGWFGADSSPHAWGRAANGWFPSREAALEFKKYGTYPGYVPSGGELIVSTSAVSGNEASMRLKGEPE